MMTRDKMRQISEHLEIRVVAILARGVVPVHELFCYCLSKCLQPSFVVSQIFSWHERRNKCSDISGASLLFDYGFS